MIMTNLEAPRRRTLSDCLHEGKLPQAEALGYAVALAQELGRIHAAGKIHGALSPAAIVLTEGGLELLPADTRGEVTPYTAPEVLAGGPSDGLSDVFLFGGGGAPPRRDPGRGHALHGSGSAGGGSQRCPQRCLFVRSGGLRDVVRPPRIRWRQSGSPRQGDCRIAAHVVRASRDRWADSNLPRQGPRRAFPAYGKDSAGTQAGCHCRAPRPTTGGSSLGDGGGAPGERSARRAALPGTTGCRDRFLPGRDEAQRKSPGLGGGYSRSATDERLGSNPRRSRGQREFRVAGSCGYEARFFGRGSTPNAPLRG